jgi:hypothetical protein
MSRRVHAGSIDDKQAKRDTPVAEHKSQIAAKPEDPRVVKTRARINAAFVELVGRSAYFRIRVSDITRKARVGLALEAG